MKKINLTIVGDYVGKVLLSISGGLFMLGTLLTFINIILRKVFNKPWTGMEETDSIMLVMLVFLPLAYLEWSNRHLAVSIFVERMPAKVQFWCKKIQHLITLLLSLYIVSATWDVVLRNFQAENKSAALGIPLYIPYLILLIGFGLTILVKTVQLFLPLHRGDGHAH